MQVHLRCMKVVRSENHSFWKQSWPLPCSVTVNTSSVKLEQAQADITRYLFERRGRTRPSFVTIRPATSATAASSGSFILFAQVILVRSSTYKQKCVEENSTKYWNNYRSSELAKEMYPNTSEFDLSRRQVLQAMRNDHIPIERQKFNLRGPLSALPIKILVRGKACTHVQYFDLASNLEYTRRSGKLNCPVCSNFGATPESLTVSRYMQHVLKDQEWSEEIEILNNSFFKPALNLKTGVVSLDLDADLEEPASKRSVLLAESQLKRPMWSILHSTTGTTSHQSQYQSLLVLRPVFASEQPQQLC